MWERGGGVLIAFDVDFDLIDNSPPTKRDRSLLRLGVWKYVFEKALCKGSNAQSCALLELTHPYPFLVLRWAHQPRGYTLLSSPKRHTTYLVADSLSGVCCLSGVYAASQGYKGVQCHSRPKSGYVLHPKRHTPGSSRNRHTFGEPIGIYSFLGADFLGVYSQQNRCIYLLW